VLLPRGPMIPHDPAHRRDLVALVAVRVRAQGGRVETLERLPFCNRF
jgi:hypothetical protein